MAVILIRLRALRLPIEIYPSAAGTPPTRARSSAPASGPSPAKILLLPKRQTLLIPYFQDLPIFFDLGSEKQGLAVSGNLRTGHFQGVPLF
jgi:hypothetical protein